jgi:hypothetical protein
MPLLALNRKDSGGESIGRCRLQVADLASTTRKRFHCGGIVAGPPERCSGACFDGFSARESVTPRLETGCHPAAGSRNRGHIAS